MHSDRSLRPMGPSIPPRSGNQESLVPGRQPRTPRPVAPRGPGGAGAAPTLPVNVPSAVSVKTSSSSDDTTQCQYCLRRVKKTDAKHHGTVCELRTETCRYSILTIFRPLRTFKVTCSTPQTRLSGSCFSHQNG